MAEEERKAYSTEMQALIDELNSNLERDQIEIVDHLEERLPALLSLAEETQDAEIFALYYYGVELLFVRGSKNEIDLEGFVNEAIHYQNLCERNDLLVRSYLALARHSEEIGDTERELVFLLTAFDIAKKNNMYLECAMTTSYIGGVCYRIRDFEKAVEYYTVAEENMEMSGRCLPDREEYCVYSLNKGNALLASNRYYEAGKYRQKILEYVENMKNINRAYPQFAVHTFFAGYDLKTENTKEMWENLKIARESLVTIENISANMDCIQDYMMILSDSGETDELTEAIDYLIWRCREDHLPVKIASVFYRMRIEVALSQDDMQTALDIGLELLSVFDQTEKGNVHVVRDAEKRFAETKENEQKQSDMLKKNEQLRLDIEKAENESRAKNSFISNMSHEIRTPINAVLGLDEMILRETTEDNIRSFATDILNAGKNLLSIVNDILDFSKIEAGKLTLIPQEYQFLGAVRELLVLINERAKKKHLEVKLDINPGIPGKLYGDDMRIKQVITNLLTNAVKYTDEGFVELKIDYKKTDEGHADFFISVKDSGIGMKEEELEKLFSPFERLDEKRNRTVEGTGIGMSIVDNILKQMNSTINVESEYGKGSTFSFTIRQEVIDWEPIGVIDINKIETEADIEKEELFTAHRVKLLVVDDTSVNLTVVKGLLKRTGIQVTTADSGRACLELCAKEKYDIILLDHRMPELDGLETLEILRSEAGLNKETPAVALTANAMGGIEEFYLSHGFAGYLAKPVNGARLERKLLELLPEELLDTEEDKVLLLDEESGIAACGEKGVFLQVVKDTVANRKMTKEELQTLIVNKDIRNYTIKVHALKNTARMVGAPGLSKEALYLEKCGDDGREETIYRMADTLISHFDKVCDSLSVKYELAAESDAPMIEKQMFFEMMELLCEYVRTFDFDSADGIINDMKKYSLPEQITEYFEKMCGMMYNYNADGVLEYAEKCITGMNS